MLKLLLLFFSLLIDRYYTDNTCLGIKYESLTKRYRWKICTSIFYCAFLTLSTYLNINLWVELKKTDLLQLKKRMHRMMLKQMHSLYKWYFLFNFKFIFLFAETNFEIGSRENISVLYMYMSDYSTYTQKNQPCEMYTKICEQHTSFEIF